MDGWCCEETPMESQRYNDEPDRGPVRGRESGPSEPPPIASLVVARYLLSLCRRRPELSWGVRKGRYGSWVGAERASRLMGGCGRGGTAHPGAREGRHGSWEGRRWRGRGRAWQSIATQLRTLDAIAGLPARLSVRGRAVVCVCGSASPPVRADACQGRRGCVA